MSSLKYSQQKDSQEGTIGADIQESFIKKLIKNFQVYNDDEVITLQQSIPIMYELNIFQQLTSIPDAKKKLTQDSKPNHRLQLQARFIYNLWKILGLQSIKIKDFKSIILLFITQSTSSLAIKLQVLFPNQKSSILQLLAIWQGMLQTTETLNQSFNHQLSQTQQFDRSLNQNKNNLNLPSRQDKIYQNDEILNQKEALEKQNNSGIERQKQRNIHYLSRESDYRSMKQRFVNSRKMENVQEIRKKIESINFRQIPSLTVQKQKQLVNRLYIVNRYERYEQMKKMQDEQRIQKQMQQCTFRPKIEKQVKRQQNTSRKNKENTNKKIPGFEKAISRMKTGQQKNKELKQKLELRNIKFEQNKEEEKFKVVVPPKFLNRQLRKQDKKVLFTIQFDIGRHKLTSKIHQNQSAEQLARNIQTIYTLKQDSYEQIKLIIEQQMKRYHELSENKESQNQQQNQDVLGKQKNKFEHNQNLEKYEKNKFSLHQSKPTNNFVFC